MDGLEWKILGMQFITFAFVFHLWLSEQGAAGVKADSAANLAITAGFVALLVPIAVPIYKRYKNRGGLNDG